MSFEKSNFKKGALLLAAVGALGMISTAESRNLQSLDPNCHVYNSDNSCQQCSFKFYKNTSTGVCTQVSDYCKTWSNVDGSCLSCYPGYGVPINGVCNITPSDSNGDGDGTTVGSGTDDIDPNCQCFNDDKTCNSCYSGYQFTNGVCTPIVSIPPTDTCSKYQYVDSKGNWYKDTKSDCKQVCVECIDGYYLDSNNQCQVLPTGCLDANPDGSCNQCDDGYALDDSNVCQVVVSTPPNTDPCAQYGYVDKWGKWYNKLFYGCQKECKSCIDGYYLDKFYKCEPLPSNCQTADNTGKCTACNANYTLDQNNVCQPNVSTPTDPCSKYSFQDSNNKVYSKWFKNCKQVCVECIDGYYLDAEKQCKELPENCLEAANDGDCTKCADGFDVANDGSCEVTVSDPDPVILGTPATWACLGYDALGQCTSCVPRTALISGTCYQVSDLCATWDNNTAGCTTCYTGYSLNNGVCK